MKNSLSTPSLISISVMVISVIAASTVQAELLGPTRLENCQMHVVGVYRPAKHGEDDRVFVEVKSTGKPMVVVLTGYFGVHWNLKVDSSADLRQVIVPGYFEHTVSGLPDDTPIELITYFPKNENSREDFFWAYAWHSLRGIQLRQRLTEMTSLKISTFQGEYSASEFTIDGRRGNQPETTSSPRPAVDRKNVEESGQAPSQLTTTKKDDPKGIQSDVREAFELQMRLHQTRIAKAEADLQRIKKQYQQRLQNAEKIIARRVATLASKNTPPKADPDVPAAVLSAEGWQAWRDQDWRTALSKFELAIKQEPQNTSALNGLGWTHLHLGSHADAMAGFEKVLRLEPAHGGAMNGLGQCQMALGRLDAATKTLTKATEATIEKLGESATVKKGVSASWFGLVQVLLRQNKPDEAIRWADRYLKHKPDDSMMQTLLEQARDMGYDGPPSPSNQP